MVLRRNERSARLEDYELIGIDHVEKIVRKADVAGQSFRS
jgi:hypothetical protein